MSAVLASALYRRVQPFDMGGIKDGAERHRSLGAVALRQLREYLHPLCNLVIPTGCTPVVASRVPLDLELFADLTRDALDLTRAVES